jgi:Fe-S cluster biogenesis protein NfuA
MQRRSMWIQTETTPNQDALKFVPGRDVLGAGATSIEFLSGRDAHNSPLAKKLFTVDGVKNIFYGPDFLTITKEESANWAVLKPEIFSMLMEYFSSGQPIMSDEHTAAASDTAASEDDDEIVSMIKELLDSRIRPAIQEDGGDIEYRGFENGVVKLKLRGACRTCDSSTVTLKNGIESMLMHYVPEVEKVEQVLDPEEQIAEQSFAEFEASLKAKKAAQSQSNIGQAGP